MTMTVGQLADYLRALPNQSTPVQIAVDVSDDMSPDADWAFFELDEARYEGPAVHLWPRYMP